MFQNLNEPTEFDYQLIQLIWRYMTVTERREFQFKIQESFSENDLVALLELSRTILTVKSHENFINL
jgi:hypothetical protein